MPKKKIQHKGKTKHAVEQTEDLPIREDICEEEEEYINVVDYESNPKFNKRKIESNWSKYDDTLLDIKQEEEEDSQKSSDFNFLLENTSSDCSVFQFRSEKQWDTEDHSALSHELFKIDLNILASGLACLPFHERIGLDENELTKEDIIRFEEAAEKNKGAYEQLIQRLNTPESDTTKNIIENLTEKKEEPLDVRNTSESSENIVDSGSMENQDLKKEIVKNLLDIVKTDDEKVKNAQKLFFNKEDENLEDWLDSVLDD